jgi:hypothetical protein
VCRLVEWRRWTLTTRFTAMRSTARRFALLSLVATLALGAPTLARAVALPFVGELSIAIQTLEPIAVRAGAIAEVGTRDTDHMTSLAFAAGVFADQHVVLQLTDPAVFPIMGLQATLANQAASLSETGGGRLRGAMPLSGIVKVCLFGPCGSAVANLDVPLGNVGLGGTTHLTGAVNITVQGAPWTTGTATVGTVANQGSRHGPASATSSTAQIDGSLNLVTPIFVSTNIGALSVVPVFGFLRLGFGSLTFPVCDDGLDNDGDGLIDFPADPGCASANDQSETDPLRVCDDGIDEDGDGKVDFPADPGCLSLDDLSESPDLLCEVEMSQSSYANGDAVVISSLRFANLQATPVATRLRLQLKLPPNIVYLVNAIDVGADGSFSIPGNFDNQLGPVTMFTVTPTNPPFRGPFEWRCAFEDPATGQVIVEDRAPFFLQ